MMEWMPWEYRAVSDDLVAGAPAAEPPSTWGGRRSIEATIETLLALNLRTATGIDLRLLRRSRPMESTADIVATDRLGRVHIFELKKGSVSAQSAAQLEQYLVGHVFADADEFVAGASAVGRKQATEFDLARDIIGVWANERQEIVGPTKILHELGIDNPLAHPGGNRLTKYRWNKMIDEEKLPLIYAALTEHARKRGLSMPPVSTVRDSASRWSARLSKSLSEQHSGPRAQKRLVVWLVGASVSSAALERVRGWRRSGIDARVLRATARSDGQRWTLGIRRERAPQRDRVENELLNTGALDRGLVRLEFYERRSASTNRRLGGALLDEPELEYREASD